jgi:hypothetical protein
MAKRIQRKRSKGWRMPENAVYVGRPTKWGNPWRAHANRRASEAVEIYRQWVEGCNHRSVIDVERIKAELRGKDLACWCPLDKPCHADVLLEIANAPAPRRG